MTLTSHKPLKVNKSWGYELILTNERDLYTGKILHFQKSTAGSLHYHICKNETWYIYNGLFRVDLADAFNGRKYSIMLRKGDCLTLPRGTVHRILCIEEGDIFESSTPDKYEDSYRIRPEEFVITNSGSSGSSGSAGSAGSSGGFM